MATKTDRPRVLIEQWLPIAEIGAECMRERGASSALPPLYFLHVWWARRPLTVSRAAILASLLPAYPTGDDEASGPGRRSSASGSPPSTPTRRGSCGSSASRATPWLGGRSSSGQERPTGS